MWGARPNSARAESGTFRTLVPASRRLRARAQTPRSARARVPPVIFGHPGGGYITVDARRPLELGRPAASISQRPSNARKPASFLDRRAGPSLISLPRPPISSGRDSRPHDVRVALSRLLQGRGGPYPISSWAAEEARGSQTLARPGRRAVKAGRSDSGKASRPRHEVHPDGGGVRSLRSQLEEDLDTGGHALFPLHPAPLGAPTVLDRAAYQTVFRARAPRLAAPPAGLHVPEAVLSARRPAGSGTHATYALRRRRRSAGAIEDTPSTRSKRGACSPSNFPGRPLGADGKSPVVAGARRHARARSRRPAFRRGIPKCDRLFARPLHHARFDSRRWMLLRPLPSANSSWRARLLLAGR